MPVASIVMPTGSLAVLYWNCVVQVPQYLDDIITRWGCGLVLQSFPRQRGAPGRTRTYDKAVNSRLLYQLSYRSVLGQIGKFRSSFLGPQGLKFRDPRLPVSVRTR